jgi:hypothetical protein
MYYNPGLVNRLRYKFPGSDVLPGNASQAGQDLFVLGMLNGMREGTYLEIGCAQPIQGNNTFILERFYGWQGLSLDIHQPFVDEFNAERGNGALLQDATTADFIKLLTDAGWSGDIIDYASVDCEPPAVTFQALQNLPFDQIKFRVLTFEHDCYAQGPEYKLASREFLRSKGYQLVVSNVSEFQQQHDFEDWWVHPDLVDPAAIELFKDDGDDIKYWLNYTYPN